MPEQAPPSSTRRRALSLLAAGPPVLATAAAGAVAAQDNRPLMTPSRPRGQPLLPQDFGAVGDGASHPVTATDIQNHPQWIGRYEPGVEWDVVGFQECLYAAFAARSTPGRAVWNSATNAYQLNRAIHIPTGGYRINRPLFCAMAGFHIEGEGKLSTRLIWSGLAGVSMWTCDSCSYGVFANFGVEAAAPTSGALLELDGSGTVAGLKTQQVSLHDMSFVCNELAAIGLRISKAGGAAQGDTILISNCYFGGAHLAGLAIGATSSQNALGITIHQGDFQACLPHGILVFGGQVFVQDTSFQNQRYRSARNQVTTGGADVTIRGGSGSNGFSVMRNIRSESDVLVHAEGGMYLENAGLYASGIAEWSPGLVQTPGYLCRGTPGRGEAGEGGRTYVCVQVGATGAREPDWRRAPRGVGVPAGRNGVTVARGSTSVSGGFRGPDGRAPAVGDYIVIAGAGADGGALISTVSAVQSNAAVTIATPATTAVSGAKGYVGAAIVDGTARWIDVDYDSVFGASCTAVSTGAGRTRSCGTYRRCLFSRNDWLRPQATDAWPAEIEWWRRPLVIEDVQVTAGAYNKEQVPHNPFAADGLRSTAPEQLSITSYGSGRIGFDTGDDNRPFPTSVAFGRGDGQASAPQGSDEDIARNVAAVWGTLGRALPATPNTPGADLDIQAGLGRGSGAGGKGYLWAAGLGQPGPGVNIGARKLEWGFEKVAVRDAAFAVAMTAPAPQTAVVDLTPLLTTGNLVPHSPARDATFSAPSPVAGQELTLVITTVGTAPRTIGFGTGFRSMGPLVTGTAPSKVYVVKFISDGAAYNEVSRTGPM